MLVYKRIQLKKHELQQIQAECEDYIWAAVDPYKCVISFGDEYLSDLRDVLLIRRCMPENIFGVGLNLATGEIDYITQINRRNPTVGVKGIISSENKESIEKTMRYFFEKLPAYRTSKEDKDDDSEYDDTSIAFC